MKTAMKIFAACLLCGIMLHSSFAIDEEYGVKRYSQPNGFSFLGRHFVDEFGAYYQTPEGYLFACSGDDEYYYYVSIDATGNLLRSQFKVGIDDPERHGIRRDIFDSPEWRARVARARGWGNDPRALRKSGPATISSVPSPINLQIILVEFSDIKHQNPVDWPMSLGYGGSKSSYPEYTATQFTNLLFSLNTYNTTSPDGEPVYGSMRDYYKSMSLNTFTLNGTIKDSIVNGIPKWIVLPNTKRYYHLGYASTFVDDVLNAASAQQGIHVTRDATNKLCIIYAGNMYVFCKDQWGNQVGGGLHPQLISNGYIINERFKYPPLPDNYDQLSASEQDQYRNREVNDASFSHCGVHSHEFGHVLGLDDQYGNPYNYGLWGLMANGGNKGGSGDTLNLNNLRGNNPAPMVPQQRFELGWLTFQNVNSKIISASIPYSLSTVYKIKGSYTSEYILVENRQTGSDWNRFLPTGGLLIWRIGNIGYGYSDVDLIEAVSRLSHSGADPTDPFPGSNNVRKLTDFTSSSNSKFISGSNSDVLVQNISNTGPTMTADLSPYWYGTVSESQTWSGTVLIGEGLTVSSGVTLTMQPATVVQVASAASLVTNGVLSVSGTSSQPITFTGSGWGSIVFNGSGANGSTINYANINNGTEVDVTSANNVTIQNCSITSSSGNGIYVYSSSNFLAQSNRITNTNSYCGINISGGSNNNCYGNVITRPDHVQRGIGILYNSSGGSVAKNDIAWCSAGIEAINGSSPTSWMGSNPPEYRNNRVTNCVVGLYIYNQSHPCFGVIADSRYGYNSIVRYSNGIYNAYVENSSSLLAHQNWWGSAPPPSTFYVGSGCSLDYSYWLTIDPWYGYPLPFTVPAPGPSKDGGKLLANANTTGGSISASNSPDAPVGPSDIDLLLTGIELRDNNKQKEAADFFRSYLLTHPENQAAYVYLYSCANSETTPELIQYFDSLPKQAAKDHKLLLSYLYLMQANVKSAKQVNNEIIDANLNTRLAARAKLNNFYITLYGENDPISASSILGEVMSSKDLSTPTELSLAQNALRTYVDPNTGKMPNSNIGQGSEGSVTVSPVPDGLMMNYPNPFNPSTTINYKLSSAGHVTLKVYNTLGQEVATLVDEYQEGGVHIAHLDGQNLASGVYFYRLTAPGISQVKKMMLIK
ncbi:MAG: right-handed parallel beta-helix repeat-containing protein [Bacteroidota bacterium]